MILYQDEINLHMEYSERYPDMILSKQNVIDRKNAIIKNKYPTAELQQIKRDAGYRILQDLLEVKEGNV